MTTTSPSPFHPALGPPAFEFAAGGFTTADFIVLGFTGEEGLSKPFKFDVEIAAPAGRDLSAEANFVGSHACLLFREGDKHRTIQGLVARVKAIGKIDDDRHVYKVLIVPPITISKNRSGSRVFQNLSVPDVVRDIYDKHPEGNEKPSLRPKQDLDLHLGETYTKREYCVQYRESDFDFAKRILAEEGIFYYFQYTMGEPTPNASLPVMVLLDRASAYPSLNFPVKLHVTSRRLDHSSAASGDVSRFEPSHRIRTNAVLDRDYDPSRPLLELSAAQEIDKDQLGVLLEPKNELRVYEHRGEFLAPDVSRRRARHQLEQHRRKAFEARGESTARLLAPAYRFELESEDNPAHNGEYIITKLTHDARLPEYPSAGRTHTYVNRFACVRSDIAYRPKVPKHVPRQVMEPAIVVGPEQGSVHTDDFGRVRVQMLWDLSGEFNEQTGTWLRVIQGWGGASFGWQFIPRVGMEVMVSFLGGDPDKPVVLGAVYNGAHPFPFRLPEHKTRGGLRTESTPGGQGYNELSFEDASGSEQIYIHAQRDLDEDIKRNRTTVVHKSQITDVKESQTNRVGGVQEEIVEGTSSRVVKSDETIEVQGNRAAAVGGSDISTITEERRVKVGMNERVEIAGAATWNIGDDLTIRTVGSHTMLVGKADAKRSYALHVEGTTDLSSKELTEIVSSEGIRLRCGESIVEIMPDHIELISPKLTMRSPDARVVIEKDTLALHAKADAVVKSGDKLLIASVGASLALKNELKASGSQILLNAPDVAKDPAREEPKPPTKIELVDENGKPLPYGRFVLVLDDGSQRSFVTNDKGQLELDDLEGSAHVRFPGLIDTGYG